MSATPPDNIVFIFSDQHRADAFGAGGEPAISTPNLDRLAAEGVLFPRTYCQIPVCLPSRTSLFSDRYPHQHEAQFHDAGDQLSADMVAYDVADERRHGAFGSKWIPEIQKLLGDQRSMATLVEDAKRLRQRTLAELRTQAPRDGSY